MNKKIKSTLALMLALLLTFSCFALCGAADTSVTQYGAEEVNGKIGYLAIGDSIGKGCGSEGSYLDQNGNPTGESAPGGQYDNYYQRNVKGAYPTLIAEAVGCNMPYYMEEAENPGATYWPLCFPGMTTAMVLDLLGVDDNFTDSDLKYPYYKEMLEYFGYSEPMTIGEDTYPGSSAGYYDDDNVEYINSLPYISDAGKRALDDAGKSQGFGSPVGRCGNIIELIQKSRLITIEIGMCDVFYRTYRIATKGGFLADNAKIDVSDPSSIGKLVEVITGEMSEGLTHWKTYYPVLLKTIKKLNPDATIVMLGSFNTVNQLRITNNDAIPLGDIVSVITDRMNTYYKKWAKEYDVIYADISNTEPYEMEEEMSLLGGFLDNAFAGSHPSQYGHSYMARQVISALKEKTPTTDIIVDLGRFDNVDYVMVNKKQITDYSMDGNVLTIPYSNGFAKLLTVAIKNDDGSIALQTYSLSYTKDAGYSASRIYGTNDAVDVVVKNGNPFFKWLKGILDKVIDFFKGLFG